VSRRDELGLLDFLRKREGGLLGYVLATSTIEQDAERFRSSGLAAVGPIALQRMRPDGHLLSWRALVPLVPGGGPGRQPWPFLIQWDVPDEQRLSWEKPGRHPNGVRGWAGVAIAVRDLERAIDFYQRHLGLELGQTDEIPRLAARRATFQVESSRIDLLMPTGEGPVQGMLEELGEGPFEVTLTVSDLKQARQVLHQGGLHVEPSSEDLASILLPFQQTLSTRLRLIEGGQR
jgi:catechol 2,3-dioxygenase-like lactoylglutathione lyase family enzyme